MGFLRRILGLPPAPPPPEPFAPDVFPFSGEIRLVSEEYDRIATGWWTVSVASPEEWDAKVAEMEQGIRSNFGRYVTKGGQVIPRWNERTWLRVRDGLVVERRR